MVGNSRFRYVEVTLLYIIKRNLIYSISVLNFLASNEQWLSLQALLFSNCKILWITAGSQYTVTNPQSALFHGFARSARAEYHTLDVQSSSIVSVSDTINRILPYL